MSRWSLALAVCVVAIPVLVGSLQAAFESGVFKTVAGATVQEWGDGVVSGSRVVPISATVTLELSGAVPTMTAFITNAVLEGGEPFVLRVRSSDGYVLAGGGYGFTGDYLGQMYAEGTQYVFDWRFTESADGRVIWSGFVYWAGGHIWQLAISDVRLEPQAKLKIAYLGAGEVRISWGVQFPEYVLEFAGSADGLGWSSVTNLVVVEGGRFEVIVGVGGARGFYRLRQAGGLRWVELNGAR